AAWSRAGELFRVRISQAQAVARLRAYGAEQGLDVRDAVAAVRDEVTFPAVALDAGGRPIPVMHTDDGLLLLFTEPPPAYLWGAAHGVARPLPAGRRPPVGVLVANPAFAPDAATRARFSRGHYHGTVVWSWQQALLAAGLARQLERDDLPPDVRAALR